MALSHRAGSPLHSAFRPGQEPGDLCGLHSARSSYLAVSSSPHAWHSTMISRQNASPALHFPQMKVILQTSGRCLGRAQGHLDSVSEKTLLLEGGLYVSSPRRHAAQPPHSWGPRTLSFASTRVAPGDSRGTTSQGDAASSWGHMRGLPATKHTGVFTRWWPPPQPEGENSPQQNLVGQKPNSKKSCLVQQACVLCSHTCPYVHTCVHTSLGFLGFVYPPPHTHNSISVV